MKAGEGAEGNSCLHLLHLRLPLLEEEGSLNRSRMDQRLSLNLIQIELGRNLIWTFIPDGWKG